MTETKVVPVEPTPEQPIAAPQSPDGKGSNPAITLTVRDAGIKGAATPRTDAIADYRERCEKHPDHEGIVTHGMPLARAMEESDDLRDLAEKLERETIALRAQVEELKDTCELRNQSIAELCGLLAECRAQAFQQSVIAEATARQLAAKGGK